jgi:hypothetical protein
MAHLPTEFLATIPTLPHAAARLSREKFNLDQQRRDTEEGLTPEILGISIQPPIPPEESTEPTPLPATEIQFMSRQITGIKVQRGRRSFKKKSTTPIVSPTAVITSSDTTNNINLSNSPIARLILRVLRYKRNVRLRNTISISAPSSMPTGMVQSNNRLSTSSEQ